MANNALKTLLKTDLVQLIKNGLTLQENYYLFVSRATPYTDNPDTTTITESDTVPPSIGESSRNVYDTFRNMLFIKRIQPDNLRIVIPRVNWTSGEVYDPYTETADMADANYYVMTSEYNVYKCMYADGTSDIMPTGKSTDIITTGDGYKWKYIYSVPEDYLGFITEEYIPVYLASVTDKDRVEQKLVQQRAKPGSIDQVSMTASLSPTFSKIFSQERFVTDAYNTQLSTVHGITPNVAGSSYIAFDASQENATVGNSYWDGYGLYITKGAGVGQYFRILSFIKNGDAGNSYYYANVTPNLSRSLEPEISENKTLFKIVPNVVVDGDGQDAVVIPNTTMAKKIVTMSIINGGKNYTYAKPRVTSEASSITLGSSIQTFNNSISAQLSTPQGHGADAIKEFGASDLMIIMEVDGTEGNKISTRNDYRQFGILKNPYLYGGLTLAGQEENVASKLLIKKEPNKTSTIRTSDDYGADTFVPNNFIIGKESRATAKIVNSERIQGSEFFQVNISDVVGNFRFSDEASLRSRVYFGLTFSGSFITGDNAFQYSGVTGLTLSASGTVISFNMYDGSLLLDCSSGAFTEGKSIFFTAGSTLPQGFIIDVDEEFGEKIGQFSLGDTMGSEFVLFGTTADFRDENYGRIASTQLNRVQIIDVGEYDLRTKLTIVSNSTPFTDRILTSGDALDGYIHQVNSTTLKKTTGTIVDFIVPSGLGLTGTIYLTDVKGSYNTTDSLFYTPYGSTAETQINATINTLTNSDIEIGSGDLLYIENVRPIERNYEQAEEFKIVIGF
jgi:hypothetical protein